MKNLIQFLSVFASVVALLICSAAQNATAQDTSTKKKKSVNSQTSDSTDEEKIVRPTRPPFFDSAVDNVDDLTEEQKAKMETMIKETGEKVKALNQAAGLTWDMVKKRKRLYQTLPVELKGKELNDRVNKEAGYNAEQIKTHQKTGELYREFRFAAMKLLTKEQQAKMTKWYQDDYANSLKIEEQKKAKASESDSPKKK